MQFKIKNVNPIGGYDKTYGQRYWGQTYDADMDISFNMINPVDFEEGNMIEFEERTIKQTSERSKNPGTEYLQLKKVKKITGQPTLKDKWDETTSGSSGSPQAPGDAVPTPSSQTQVQRKPVAAALYNPNYAKDLTDMPVRLYTANLNYAKDIGLNLVDNKEDRRKYYEYIQDITNELLTWIQNIRSGEDINKTAEEMWPDEPN